MSSWSWRAATSPKAGSMSGSSARGLMCTDRTERLGAVARPVCLQYPAHHPAGPVVGVREDQYADQPVAAGGHGRADRTTREQATDAQAGVEGVDEGDG